MNVFITGFSGTGKTTTGHEVARLLGWTFVDMDDEIVASTGVAIEDIFRQHGEEEFRRLERETLAKIARADSKVVSTGGGTIMDERNRATMESSGVVVLLEARPDTIIRRLQEQQVEQGADLVARPMLDSDDLLQRVHSLKAERQFNYTLAHWTVHTDFLTPSEAAAEVVRGLDTVTARRTRASDSPDPDLAAEVRTSSSSYPLWVGWNIIEELGERVRGVLDTRAAYVISDIGAQSAGQARPGVHGEGRDTDAPLLYPLR